MREIIGCPSCGSKLRLPPGCAGQTVQCPTCGTRFTPEAEIASAIVLDEPRRGGWNHSEQVTTPPERRRAVPRSPRRVRRAPPARGRGPVVAFVLLLIALVVLAAYFASQDRP